MIMLAQKNSTHKLLQRFIPIISVCVVLILQTTCSKRDNAKEQHLNRLANASSPYLQEHADNPVDWYEWGVEALDKAKRENKPLIISVGYASCHWCHVMERESFMDTAVARFMNDNFVSIKVDREERPDIDQIYINTAQLISGNAGWPLNAFALPDGKPFYAATYFPKEQWLKVLQQIVAAYKNDNATVVTQAEALTKGIQTYDVITPPSDYQGNYSKKNYQDIFSSCQSQFDYQFGGLSGSPKFPMPVVWEYVLQNYYLTGNKKSLDAVTVTLEHMAKGGIYDQLGGGFARYATDSMWRIPHFEKMLYDNAQLISLYSHAYLLTKSSLYENIIHETLEFIKKELTSPEGGFYSSLNADTDDEEGKFYVWRKAEIEDIQNKRAASLVVDYYNITDSGNWEDNKNILFINRSDNDFASSHAMTIDELKEQVIRAKQILLKERNKRIRPSIDTKILTSWNALMLTGYVDAFFASGRQEYLQTALKNANFLEKKMINDEGRLWRNYKGGVASVDAFLDDYALLANAFIRLYEATFDIHWLEQARSLAEYAILHFQDKQSGLFFYTANEAEYIVARKKELADNVIPSSNSVMADVLYRLGEYYDKDSYRKMSTSMLRQLTNDITKNGAYYANWASLMGLITYKPFEVAILGNDATDITKQMKRTYLPTVLYMGGMLENLPLLENKYVKGETIIYVCRDKVCKLPTKDVSTALHQIKE